MSRSLDRGAEAVLAPLTQLIAAAAERPAAEVVPGARFDEDLGVDSLEMAALLVDIEHHFGVVIVSGVLAHVETVDDMHQAVRRLLRERAA